LVSQYDNKISNNKKTVKFTINDTSVKKVSYKTEKKQVANHPKQKKIKFPDFVTMHSKHGKRASQYSLSQNSTTIMHVTTTTLKSKINRL